MVNTVESTIKQAGFLQRSIIKTFIKNFENELQSDEQIIGMCTEYLKPGSQLYVTNSRATTRKLIKPLHTEEKSIPISKILSVETKTYMNMYMDIIIKSSETTLKIDKVDISIAKDIKRLIESKIL